MKIKSLSDKRLIVEVEMKGRQVPVMIDTGASVALLDASKIKKLGVTKGKRYAGTLVGAGGKFDAWHCMELTRVGGKLFGQWLIADISGVVESVKRETGIEIAGIMSLPQMRTVGMSIDTDEHYITVD